VIADLLPLLNKAVHSEEYSREAAGWAITIGPEQAKNASNLLHFVPPRGLTFSTTPVGLRADTSLERVGRRRKAKRPGARAMKGAASS
jgi:hypothetical protein